MSHSGFFYSSQPRCGFPADSDLEKEEESFNASYASKISEQTHSWENVFKSNHGTILKKTSALRSLARNGIPMQFRAKVWMEVSGAARRMEENAGYYEKMIDVHLDVTQATVAKEIEMDLDRTYPSHPLFADDAPGRDMLRRILIAYSWRNPLLGYCQSLNYVVGFMLLFLTEEQSFWLLVTIVEDILPANFWNAQLIGLRIDLRVLMQLCTERVPKVASHIKSMEIDLALVCTGWFLRLYADVFPMETTCRIWDSFLFEGHKVLFRAALAFFKMHESVLISAEHMGEFLHISNSLSRKSFDAHKFMQLCFSFRLLKREDIERMREDARPAVMKETKEMESRREAFAKKRKSATSSPAPSRPSLSASSSSTSIPSSSMKQSSSHHQLVDLLASPEPSSASSSSSSSSLFDEPLESGSSSPPKAASAESDPISPHMNKLAFSDE